MNFDNLGLITPLLTAVRDCGYNDPTPIQRETIPPVLLGRDVLGCAQTGTGKTAAFALPILQRLYEKPKQGIGKRPIRALILTPTRELALQNYENFTRYGKNLPLRSCVIFGGVGQQPQVAALKGGVDILVATPGRLNDLIGQGCLTLDRIEIFVLDEADRMLDMGFIHDVRKVIALLPRERQTLLFSATMPAEVEKLAMGTLNNPVAVKVDPVSSTVDAIEQRLYMIDKANKKLLLAKLLNSPEVESALVFTRTKHGADRVVRELAHAGLEAKAIHGNKSQNARQQALSEFKTGQIHVLIATDIAARGIDIAGLSHVINYDIPNEPEAYVHRIGRTGRAGLDGIAISFCCFDELQELKAVQKLIGKEIPRLESDWPMRIFVAAEKSVRPGASDVSRIRVADRKPERPQAARSHDARIAAKPLGTSAAQGRKQPNPAIQTNAKPLEAREETGAKPAVNRATRAMPERTSSERKAQRAAVRPKPAAVKTNTAAAQPEHATSAPPIGRAVTQPKPVAAPSKPTAAKAQPAVAQTGHKMTATPLERTAHASPPKATAKGSDERPHAEEERFVYLLKRDAQRKPLSTGTDRR